MATADVVRTVGGVLQILGVLEIGMLLGLRYEHWRNDRWKPKLEAIPTDRPAEKVEPAIRGFQH